MNILVVGDSISSISGCGLGKDQLANHYVIRLEEKNHTVTNLSVGGQSNEKIAHKTCLEITKNANYYDLVIVQWSSLFRLNLNLGNSIYDKTCNFTVRGYDTNFQKICKPIWSSWVEHFMHPRIEILEWASQLILLNDFLSHQKIPYVFIRGFDNFFDDIKIKDWTAASDEFKSTVLQLDNYPDWEISEIYSELVTVYNCVSNQHNWLNLTSSPWTNMAFDVAEDNAHPGPLSHTQYYNSLEQYIKKFGLSF